MWAQGRGRCGGGLLGVWLDSLHETGQKQDPTAQGRDHREAVGFCGEEENAKFD